MTQDKIKQRFENAFDAFFDNEMLEDAEIAGYDSTGFLTSENEFSGREIFKSFATILRQVFLFLPGTFLLLMTSCFFTWLVINPNYGMQPTNLHLRF